MKSYLSGLMAIFMLFVLVSCSEDSTNNVQCAGNQGSIGPNTQVYNGPAITFSKPGFADFNLAENQDRITDNVWITRANNQSIFNVRTENRYNEDVSPADTEWARGTLSELETLCFDNFDAVTGNQKSALPGQTFVVHLITDDIYLELTFLSWGRQSEAGGGSFSYSRTTP